MSVAYRFHGCGLPHSIPDMTNIKIMDAGEAARNAKGIYRMKWFVFLEAGSNFWF